MQFFLFGASIVYGVGGKNGGWADMLKRKLHLQMYSTEGEGEKHELYNFAKPGATVEFVVQTFESQIEKYRGDDKAIAVVSVGMNNSKAVDTPKNYISTIESYRKSMIQLLKSISNSVDEVICVGYTPVDEDKTLSKQNPLSGEKSYFWNNRLMEFDAAFKKICEDFGITFIDLMNTVDKTEWKRKNLYKDGLHPNSAGHKFIFEKVWAEVKKMIS